MCLNHCYTFKNMNNKTPLLLFCFLLIAIAMINACSRQETIKNKVATEDKSIIVDSDSEQKIYVTKNIDEYRLYVRLSTNPNPFLILKSKRALYLPRLSKNEGIAVYVSDESGSANIVVQEVGSGMRRIAAPVDNQLESIEFGNSDYEIVYKYINGDTFYLNVDQLLGKYF